jgi:hypothetical protein
VTESCALSVLILTGGKLRYQDLRFEAHDFQGDANMTKLPELSPFDHQLQPYGGLSPEEVLPLRRHFLNPALFLDYKRPFDVALHRLNSVSTRANPHINAIYAAEKRLQTRMISNGFTLGKSE